MYIENDKWYAESAIVGRMEREMWKVLSVTVAYWYVHESHKHTGACKQKRNQTLLKSFTLQQLG
jgi:hypothetical protein